jgi:ferredoxin
MCDFCHKHGEGEKWYLNAKNYSEDLLSDLRRRKLITDFLSDPESLEEDMRQMRRLDDAPGFVRRVLSWHVSRKMKRDHFGQVVPIEDIERIFDFVGSIVRVACICRHIGIRSEARYCYGVSMAPDTSAFEELVQELQPAHLTGPDTAGLETLSKEEALASFRDHEDDGLCHTVWTFGTPFIGGICNCDRTDCMAMQAQMQHEIPVMFRAEYVAGIDSDLCNGCRTCMRHCQFGAISYSAAREKSVIDLKRCYGCGICRAACPKDAISLSDRGSVQIAANLW